MMMIHLVALETHVTFEARESILSLEMRKIKRSLFRAERFIRGKSDTLPKDGLDLNGMRGITTESR